MPRYRRHPTVRPWRAARERRGSPSVLVAAEPGTFRRLLADADDLDLTGVPPAEAGERALELRPAVFAWLGSDAAEGLAVLRQLRGARSTARTLYLTPRSAESERLAALEAGVDDVLSEPITRSELVGRLRLLLRRARPTRALSPSHQPTTWSWTSIAASSGVTAIGSTCAPRKRACWSSSRGLRAASSHALTSWSASGARTTPATRAPWTSTCAGCAPRSSLIRTTRSCCSRCEASATASSRSVNVALTKPQRHRSRSGRRVSGHQPTGPPGPTIATWRGTPACAPLRASARRRSRPRS